MLTNTTDKSVTITPSIISHNGHPTNCPCPQIYAHRGGRGLFAESTLHAYRFAASSGIIDYVDMDVVMTRDGILVVHHNLTLNPTITRDKNGAWLSKTIPINQLDYSNLRHYNVGAINPQSAYANYFPQQQTFAYAAIPSLKQIIEEVKILAGNRVGFQIEIKSNPLQPHLAVAPETYAKALSQLLTETDVIDRTEVQCFDFRCLLALKAVNPAIKTAFLTIQPESQDPRWTAGYQVSDYNHSFVQMVKALGADCWGPFEMDLTEETLHQAHDLGLKVVVWGMPEKEKTEFNYRQIKRLIEWGVDGIITDRPDELYALISTIQQPAYTFPSKLTVK